MLYLSIFIGCVALGFLFETYLSRLTQVKRAINDAAEDGVTTQDELDRINALAQSVGLSENAVQAERLSAFSSQISEALVRSRVQGYMAWVDYELIQSKARSFGVSMKFENNILFLIYKGMLKEAKELSFFDLTDSEFKIPGKKILFRSTAHWYEGAMIKQNLGTSHFGASMRIAKGLTLHTGRSVPVSKEHEGYKSVSSGTLILTEDAFHFIGNSKSQKIGLSEIISIKWFSDGLKLFTESGSPDLFLMDERDADLVELIAKHISENQERVEDEKRTGTH